MSFIETKRLMLRTWIVPGDVDAAAAIFTDPEVMRYSSRGAYRPDEIRGILERALAREEREGFTLWPVVHKEMRELIGMCGLQHLEEGADIEIGWRFKRSAWGNGYATEAASAVLAYARDHLRLPRVCAVVEASNQHSIRVANRVGMRFDRVTRAYHREVLRYVT
jgi:RimJ/RimL family protein N-acetyltransferase